MNRVAEVLAKKYAQAYFNLYGDAIDADQYQHLRSAIHVLSGAKHFLFLMQVPFLTTDHKNEIRSLIVKICGADQHFERLLDRLYEDRRFVLLPRVIKYIVHEYQQQHGLMLCTISYAPEIANDQKVFFESFFDALVDKTVEFRHQLDRSLIAGVRFQAEAVMWEYSIQKQLRKVQEMVQQKGS